MDSLSERDEEKVRKGQCVTAKRENEGNGKDFTQTHTTIRSFSSSHSFDNWIGNKSVKNDFIANGCKSLLLDHQ